MQSPVGINVHVKAFRTRKPVCFPARARGRIESANVEPQSDQGRWPTFAKPRAFAALAWRHYMKSDDRDFEAKAADIIGLYLRPPAHAAVFCVDEKSAIQALDRLDPVLPLSPGRAERHGFEYFRHGTLSLYAALNTASGEVLGKTANRHTSAEFVVFLQEVVASVEAGRQIHIIADNLSTHKTKAVEAFLREHPRVRLHFTPTYSSWLNQVEIWFSKIQRDIIARG